MIERSFVTKNFVAAMDFLNKAAVIAEEQGHHPDFHITSYRNVSVVLYTHNILGFCALVHALCGREESVRACVRACLRACVRACVPSCVHEREECSINSRMRRAAQK